MYSSCCAVAGGVDSEEFCQEIGFDNDMRKFLKNEGPPPYPLAAEVRGEPVVVAYYIWYQRVGSALTEKWYREHPRPLKPSKPAPNPIQKPIQITEEKPRRIIEPPTENSGW